MKLKYYQLAHKNGTFKTIVSPNTSMISNMITNGWNFYGFNNLSDVPKNPIIDGDTIREMTAREISDKAESDALALFNSEVASLNECSKLELYEAMSDLNILELFEQFKKLPKFDLTNDFRFNHTDVISAMSTLDDSILQSIKEQIIKNRN